MNRLLRKYTLKEVPLSPGLVVRETMPLRQVVELMQNRKTGCVLTQRGSQFTGIFTERDLLTKVMGESIDWNTPVIRFTTKTPVVLGPKEPLRKALFLMRRKHFRHIPVLNENGELEGVLSIRNVVKLFAEHFPKEVVNLPPRLSDNIPLTPEGG